jgi:multidrug efflux pump subunit AcrA (membrane-fusion protein)
MKNAMWFLLTWSIIPLLLSACSGLGGTPAPTEPPESETEFTPVVSATGVVVPARWAVLSLGLPGKIEQLLVKEDQVVTDGDVLLRLEGQEELQAAVSAANPELQSAEQALDDLYEAPEVREASAAQAIVTAEQALDDAQRRLRSLQSIAEQFDIEQAQANLVLARDRLDKAQEDYDPYANKPEDNLVRAALLSKLAQARQEYEQAERLLNNLIGQASELDLREAEAEVDLAEANLIKAQQDYRDLQAGPDPDAVRLGEARVENAREQLAASEAALQDLELLAPFGGTVSGIEVRASEWVQPGQPVMTLADLDGLRIETTDLNEIDVARLEVGDTVIVTFDALPDMEVRGKVTRIASKAAEGSGVNYPVVIEMDEVPEQLRWGMTAFVDIEVD